MLVVYCDGQIHILQNPNSFFGQYWRHCLLRDAGCNYCEFMVVPC